MLADFSFDRCHSPKPTDSSGQFEVSPGITAQLTKLNVLTIPVQKCGQLVHL